MIILRRAIIFDSGSANRMIGTYFYDKHKSSVVIIKYGVESFKLTS